MTEKEESLEQPSPLPSAETTSSTGTKPYVEGKVQEDGEDPHLELPLDEALVDLVRPLSAETIAQMLSEANNALKEKNNQIRSLKDEKEQAEKTNKELKDECQDLRALLEECSKK